MQYQYEHAPLLIHAVIPSIIICHDNWQLLSAFDSMSKASVNVHLKTSEWGKNMTYWL